MTASSPRVAIFHGGHLGAKGGMAQVTARLLSELHHELGDRCSFVSEDGRGTHDLIHAPPVASGWSRMRRRLIRAAQTTPVPVLRWTTGGCDVYHYIGTSVRPRVPSARLIVSTYDLGGERWPDEARYPAWAGTVLRRAARILTLSEFSKEELSRYYAIPPARIEVIYPGVDHQRFHPRRTAADEGYLQAALGGQRRPYLLCAGGQTERKNVARLIEAFARVQPALEPSRRLMITGVAPRSAAGIRYISLARDLGIGGLVILPGYLADEVMPALYRGAEAVVVPSLYEGFGLPVIQGMACGIPVLASNASSLPEVAGGAALCVDAIASGGLATGLLRLLTDHPLRARLRRRGLERAAVFTWQRCARQTIAVYQDVALRADACSRHGHAGTEGVDP
ncbi:MAG: hypothetical protein NVSMB65_02450 [Chloroflexota bacterium]